MTEMPDFELPFFAYGALKSGEMAHRIVEPFLSSECVLASGLEHALWVVDGVAKCSPSEGSSIQGQIMHFKNPEVAYADIAKFEDVPNFYSWQQLKTSAGFANVLIATEETKSRQEKVGAWSSANDGLLAYGIPWAYQRIINAQTSGRSTSSDYEFWLAYHDLQSTFQLLWSITERILLFHDGPEKRDRSLGAKVGWLKDMRTHPGLKVAVTKAGIDEKLGIRSNSAPQAEHPRRTGEFGFQAWYDMRNNIVHRGKSTHVERGILLTSTVDLHNTLAYFLQNNSEPIKKLWTNLTSDEKPPYSTWLYKIQR